MQLHLPIFLDFFQYAYAAFYFVQLQFQSFSELISHLFVGGGRTQSFCWRGEMRKELDTSKLLGYAMIAILPV